jgi:hypothetical protein
MAKEWKKMELNDFVMFFHVEGAFCFFFVSVTRRDIIKIKHLYYMTTGNTKN